MATLFSKVGAEIQTFFTATNNGSEHAASVVGTRDPPSPIVEGSAHSTQCSLSIPPSPPSSLDPVRVDPVWSSGPLWVDPVRAASPTKGPEATKIIAGPVADDQSVSGSDIRSSWVLDAAESTTVDTARSTSTEVASEVERIKELVRLIYEKHNPDKLPELDAFFIKYASNERNLYTRVCKKYGVDADPEFAETLPTPVIQPAPPEVPHIDVYARAAERQPNVDLGTALTKQIWVIRNPK